MSGSKGTKTIEFTPRESEHSDKRLLLLVDWASYTDSPVSERTLGYKGDVKDVHTGKRYRVYGAPCSAPKCNCDAYVEEITE
jgi:hypothetical protein